MLLTAEPSLQPFVLGSYIVQAGFIFSVWAEADLELLNFVPLQSPGPWDYRLVPMAGFHGLVLGIKLRASCILYNRAHPHPCLFLRRNDLKFSKDNLPGLKTPW